jgi:SRSO17 transposase
LVEGIADAFATFIDRYHRFFRTKTRDCAAVAARYLRGLAQAEDCTFAEMATVVDQSCPQQFQHFISNSPWDHEAVVAQIGRDADRLLGGKPTSSLIIDESSFAKQGDRSVGVARQWSGRLGKVDNCQVAVFGVLSDGQRHAPVDMRLYLPKEWIDDPARCDQAGIPPKARALTSKSQHALDIVRQARARGMRFEWVGVDAGYGKEPAFLRALDDVNEVFVADVHRTQRIWTERPELAVPPSQPGRGRAAKKRQASGESVTVENLVKGFGAGDWTRYVLRDCTRGQLQVDLAHRRVWVWDGEEDNTAVLASDRPARSEVGEDDQILSVQCPGGYASAVSWSDAGATLLGRAHFRGCQGRVRPGGLSMLLISGMNCALWDLCPTTTTMSGPTSTAIPTYAPILGLSLDAGGARDRAQKYQGLGCDPQVLDGLYGVYAIIDALSFSSYMSPGTHRWATALSSL